MLLTVAVFILGPQLRAEVASAGPAALLLFIFVWGAAATLTLLAHSILAASAFISATCFITLICPMWLVRLSQVT